MKKEVLTLNRDILSIQLLEISISLINGIQKYAEENGIILGESQKLDRLLVEAKTLLEEENWLAQSTLQKYHSRRFLTRRKSDEDLTEPIYKTY